MKRLGTKTEKEKDKCLRFPKCIEMCVHWGYIPQLHGAMKEFIDVFAYASHPRLLFPCSWTLFFGSTGGSHISFPHLKCFKYGNTI